MTNVSGDASRLALSALTTVSAIAVITGCSAGPGAHPSGGPTAPPAAPVTITDAQNGGKVNVAKGDLVVVMLGSTYWTIAATSDATILKADAAATVVPSPGGCVPGQGCGTVEQEFTAVGDGTTMVTASRTTCGEALRCTDGEGTFGVTIVVSG